jgi:hypothetical protein
MTPLEIEILMHYCTRGKDYRDGDFSAPAVREAIDNFVREGVIKPSYDARTGMAYAATDRARVFLDYICALPLPDQVWQMKVS